MADSRITVVLRDRNQAIVDAWTRHFGSLDEVEIGRGDIFDVEADAIVSPANSFGYMDGGIDAVYLDRFGAGLQHRLQTHLREHHYGELAIGQAVIVETVDSRMPWLVSAPTMRVPMPVPHTVNAYLAFRAALIAVVEHNARSQSKIERVLCPGLATAIGRMSPERCATQMRLAWDIVLGGRRWPPMRAGEVLELHAELTRG
ncbi:MAG: macro domain-containing protein [Myxococcota bacterium]